MKSILTDEWFLKILPITKLQFNRKFDTIFYNLEKLNLEFYTFCETGCIRSLSQFDWQGNFTLLANRFTEIHNGIVYSMNIDENAIKLCTNLSNVNCTCMDSIKYLKNFEKINEVNLFYLDSMDIEINNPIPSSTHHYYEFYTIIQRRNIGDFFLCIDDNVSDTVQKGFFINNLCKKLEIIPIFHEYQTLYWITEKNLNLLKENLYDLKPN